MKTRVQGKPAAVRLLLRELSGQLAQLTHRVGWRAVLKDGDLAGLDIVARGGAGSDASGSPIGAAAMAPPSSTISGFTPKKAGCHSTRSARLPTSTEPMCLLMP